MRLTSIVSTDAVGGLRDRLRDAGGWSGSARRAAAFCSPRRLWAAVDLPRRLRHLRTESERLAARLAEQLADVRAGRRGRDADDRVPPRTQGTPGSSVTDRGISPSDTVSMVRSSLVLTWAAVSARVGAPRPHGRLR